MPRKGNPDGKISNKWRQEHVISRLLHEKGVNRKNFRLRIGIKSTQYYNKVMKNPAAHLSVNQLAMVAGVLELPLLEVLGLVMGKNAPTARKWYIDNANAL